MSASATAQRSPSIAGDERPALSAMAFVSDTVTLSRVSADLFNMTLGKANVREGTIDSRARDQRMAARPRPADRRYRRRRRSRGRRRRAQDRGARHLPGDRRRPHQRRGALSRPAGRRLQRLPGDAVRRRHDGPRRRARAGGCASAPAARSCRTRGAAKDAKPRTLSVIGARGGVGTTTAAVTIAAMLGTRLQEEVLLIDFDLHYGSLMLALDLEAIDALREALDQPDRIDALFIQQVAQKKSEYLYAMGAEEPPTGGFQARPHAASDFLRSFHRRFRWIVADVPRGDPAAPAPGDRSLERHPADHRPSRCRACATPCACSRWSMRWRPAPSCTSPPAARSTPGARRSRWPTSNAR